MITIFLMGGLGNQMFQYAFGRRLAIERNTELLLDLSWFSHQNLRQFTLNNFDIKANYDIFDRLNLDSRHLFINQFYNLAKKIKSSYLRRSNKIYYESLIRTENNKSRLLEFEHFFGYWQNEDYFYPIKNIIQEDFKIKNISDKYLFLTNQIKTKQSVSIHIRRGDYANNKTINSLYGLISMEYYQKSIEYIKKKVEKPVFFVFTDDPEWVKNNFNLISEYTLVSSDETKDDSENLHLMSLCKHQIIANSSFSWWGAWLNENPEKIIISPGVWKSDPDFDVRSLIPRIWKII